MRSRQLRFAGALLVLISSPGLTHPLDGTWFNSYCSRVDLSVSDEGQIQGLYTSHTGSTGTSLALGQVSVESSSTQTNGIPFALGIQWRLVNVDASNADGSWHWVSMFSGQYHPEQTITEPGQDPYSIPETLEILNALIATATLSGLTDISPVTWPQTLDFHRNPPSYCHSVEPGKVVPYSATASDNISGSWNGPNGDKLVLNADLGSGTVTGTYVDNAGNTFNVAGLFDTLAPPAGGQYSVSLQGLTLALKAAGAESEARSKALAGGVEYADKTTMSLWTSDLSSTSWTDRFTQQTLDKYMFSKE